MKNFAFVFLVLFSSSNSFAASELDRVATAMCTSASAFPSLSQCVAYLEKNQYSNYLFEIIDSGYYDNNMADMLDLYQQLHYPLFDAGKAAKNARSVCASGEMSPHCFADAIARSR